MTYTELESKIGKQIESEWHQHKKGNGWVHKNATVDETVFISGIVFSGKVYGNAWVYGNARVYGNAWKKSPLFIVGSRFSMTNCKCGHIQIGCLCHTFEDWKTEGLKLADENNFTPEEIEEYTAYIDLFIKIGK